MNLRGIITKSTNGQYTVTIKCGTETLYKRNNINYLEDAQWTLKTQKEQLINSDVPEYIRSFPELEGKLVRFSTERNDYTGKVIGCDYHIGITIIDVDDKNQYLTCIRGPLSVQGKKIMKERPLKYNTYPALFAEAVKAIQSGVYVADRVKILSGSPKAGTGAGPSACAFGA